MGLTFEVRPGQERHRDRRRLPHAGPGSSDLLLLQQSAGNAAVSEALRRGTLRSLRLLELQRQADTGRVPAGLTCAVSTGAPPEVGTAVIFAKGGAVVEPELLALIRGFVKDWNDVRGTGPGSDIIVDGYGSMTGTQELNWRLSCSRAEAVRVALIAQGVPSGKIRAFAHGATNVFDPSPLRNQRAMISPADPTGFRGTFQPQPSSALAVRKNALLSLGATELDMAVAMLETDTMTANYPFGDGKIEDAANFGIFKQNWHYIRTSGAMPPTPSSTMSGAGLAKSDWRRGALLNTNLALDVAVLHASQAKLGLDEWFAAHRQGETGQRAFQVAARAGVVTAAQRATLSDIANYRDAVEWIRDQLLTDPALRIDSRKAFVRVPPV